MANKSLYSKELSITVAKDAQPKTSVNYHVIHGDARTWGVVPEGRVRAVKAFKTQRGAVSFAKRNASKKTGQVIIHGRTGQIKDIVSYVVK